MQFQPGTSLGPYEVLSLLGRGGMGEVYVAQDPRLRRRVALKVLPAALSVDGGVLERFQREAESLAALSHPNIVTIYSVEHDADTHFLTMELVQGRSLAEVLTEGALEGETFFEIAAALADAVAAAHAAGIVHRDLKPANLMLTEDGRLKVLDFGLAKLSPGGLASRDETMARVTAFGGVVGTAPYMSPEQANGRPVDERSDIFSLGTVLYELATGRRPFEGDDLTAVLYAVSNADPIALRELRADLPVGLEGLVARCMVKDPRQRGLSAGQLRDELRALSRAPATARAPDGHGERTGSRRPVLAVLPFRSTTADSEIEDFAASLGSDVVDGVASTSQAVVLPSSATQRYGRGDVDPQKIGREIGASYIVQGSVRRGGPRLRVNVQLTSTESGAQIWSRRYDRGLGELDLFDAGDEIRAQIVSAVSDVHGVVFELERQRVLGRPIAELDEWECIFLSLGYDKFIDAEHHRMAREALERAVEIEPGLSLAWGYLSWVVTDEEVYGFNPLPDSMTRAMAAARRSVELDPHSHMARWLLSRVHFYQGNLDGFLSESEKSLELSAEDATTVGLIGLFSSLSGHWQRGDELLRRAMALNPSYPSYYHWGFALDHLRQGHYEEALGEYRRIAFSGNPLLDAVLVACLGHLDRGPEAATALGDLLELLPDPSPEALRVLFRRANHRGELLEQLMSGLAKAGLEGDTELAPG